MRTENQTLPLQAMKHLKSFFVTLLLLCSSVAGAYDFEVDGIYYSITSNSEMSVSVTGNPYSYSGVLTIPETVSWGYGTYTVTSIGDRAFVSCSSLTGITLPNSVTAIGTEAFMDCNALAGITLPANIQTIGDRAFANCSSLTGLVIPDGVTSIGGFAFVGCSSLTSIVVECDTPPTITAATFLNVTATLYVPYGAKASYMAATGWKDFPDIVEMEPEVPEVPVTEVTITINEYGSGTYCSEYALDFSEVVGLKAYCAIGFNSGTQVVTLARVMATEAKAGILIKGVPGSYTVPVVEECNDHTLNLLVGTLETVTVNSTADGFSNYKFTIIEGDEAPRFYPFEDNTTFSAGKAYLQIPTAWLPATAEKSVAIRFDEGETTDVDEVKGKNGEMKTVYDLQGRMVENPVRGVYVVNGKRCTSNNLNHGKKVSETSCHNGGT